jgi:hypothetical protein
MSASSFSVIDGTLTWMPGKFIPLWLVSGPPCTTRAVTRGRRDVERHGLEQPVVDETRSPTWRSVAIWSYVTGDLARPQLLALGDEHDVSPGTISG